MIMAKVMKKKQHQVKKKTVQTSFDCEAATAGIGNEELTIKKI